MINFIVWVIVGALAGWLAGIVMSSRHGLITNIILGVVGSFVGGLSIGHILTAAVGAIVIIAAARFIRRA